MLCGGAEEVHSSVTGVFDLMRAASCNNVHPRQACRPFDQDRDGVVCGGGSGILVLENYESARARGARIYGEIVGFGNVNDSGHIANPDTHSMARAMTKAMQEGGLRAEDIDYVNAHATGTELGDIAEAAAICSAVDGDTPVSSFKGHLGHTLGAAGALELIAVLEMLERQEIIPTRNLERIDPRCAVANLETTRRKANINAILKNNFALGGVNTSLAIKRMIV
jgi:3-oxoacyl-[acyl-carrier-protein] synthase II